MAKSKQLTRLEPWHHDLIDWWIANPRASGREAAARFGVSAVWISIVKHSPLFEAEFKRRRERLSRGVEDSIRSHATAVAEVSLDTALERLERNRDSIPMRDVNQMIKTSAGLLGLGRRAAVPLPRSPLVWFSVDPEVLAEARERARHRTGMREAEDNTEKPG